MDKMEGHVQAPADAPTRVRQLWEDIAWPFLSAHPHLLAGLGKKKGAVQKERGWALYCWATGAVASYSFVLGDDQFHVSELEGRLLCKGVPLSGATPSYSFSCHAGRYELLRCKGNNVVPCLLGGMVGVPTGLACTLG
jgi:hypothetical protein